MRTRDDLVGIGAPIDGGDDHIVTDEPLDGTRGTAALQIHGAIDPHFGVIAAHGQQAAVGVPCVARDGRAQLLLPRHFGRCHLDRLSERVSE